MAPQPYKNMIANAPAPTSAPLATLACAAAAALEEEAALPDVPEAVEEPLEDVARLVEAEFDATVEEVVDTMTVVLLFADTATDELPTSTVVRPVPMAGIVAMIGCVVTTLGWVVTTPGWEVTAAGTEGCEVSTGGMPVMTPRELVRLV